MKGDRNANPEAPYSLLVGQNNLIAGVRTGGVDYPISWNLVYLGLDPKLWHHVAVTFRADLNVLNLWLDGTHIAHQQVPKHSVAGNSLPVEIGRNGPTTGKYWRGKLNDVRIWNVARQGTDITATFNSQLTGPQPGLVANWHFDPASGAKSADNSGNGHSATLTVARVTPRTCTRSSLGEALLPLGDHRTSTMWRLWRLTSPRGSAIRTRQLALAHKRSSRCACGASTADIVAASQ